MAFTEGFTASGIAADCSLVTAGFGGGILGEGQFVRHLAGMLVALEGKARGLRVQRLVDLFPPR